MLIIQRPEIEAGEPEGNLQRFTIAPLEPGFGHTLGNSLRRTLLSSIPGASVTQVRFDDALHEFDVIKGVNEDVTDVILNLKDLVLTCTSDEPVTLRLDKRGPGEVRAGDVQTTSDVEILNPDLYIATVNATGRLAFDITVEQGRGYLSAERNKRTVTIGVIPVDAIFSPVRRVSFPIEPTRVEKATNFDKLNLEIETDGSITPRDALASAGDTLRKLVDLVAELADEPRGLELGEIASPMSTSPDLDLAIEELDLSERPRNCLKRARVDTIGQLVQKSEDDLLAITNFGSKSLEEVIEKLDERGLSLRVKEEHVPAPPKGPRFGGSPSHNRAMMANLAAHLIAAEGITTTEAKAKALRPYVEKLVTKAKHGGVHRQRLVVARIHDRDMTHKLFTEI